MANCGYQPDPYQGWRVINHGAGNVTAHQILNDTSGTWQLVSIVAGIRQYRRQ
jgi:hypothetical protein